MHICIINIFFILFLFPCFTLERLSGAVAGSSTASGRRTRRADRHHGGGNINLENCNLQIVSFWCFEIQNDLTCGYFWIHVRVWHFWDLAGPCKRILEPSSRNQDQIHQDSPGSDESGAKFTKEKSTLDLAFLTDKSITLLLSLNIEREKTLRKGTKQCWYPKCQSIHVQRSVAGDAHCKAIRDVFPTCGPILYLTGDVGRYCQAQRERERDMPILLHFCQISPCDDVLLSDVSVAFHVHSSACWSFVCRTTFLNLWVD